MSMLSVSLASEVNTPLKSILLATDFSPASEGALQQALGLARNFNAKLYMAHIVSSLGLTMAGPEAICISASLAQRDACLLERKLILNGSLRNVRHKTIVREGDVWQELQKLVWHERVDLVIVGTHSRLGVAKVVLGSIAEEIFRKCVCPVLTVGPNVPGSFQSPTNDTRPLLFPTDFGEPSLAAFPYAVSIANKLETRLVLLHVLTNRSLNKTPAVPEIERVKNDARQAAVLRLESLAQTAELDLAPTFVVKVANAADGILDAAQSTNARSIIMGLHRKNNADLASHSPWSTAYGVICGANCPVLTVRTA